MNDAELRKLFTDCVSGDISPEQHELLQEVLKGDSQARAAFREFMDLEAGLRTWATEDAAADLTHATPPHRIAGERSNRRLLAAAAAAASVALVAMSLWVLWYLDDSPQPIALPSGGEGVATFASLGTIRQTEGCVWEPPISLASGSKFSRGTLSLVSGNAELQFTSGTNIVLEGPCELEVLSADAAYLLAGKVFVDVTELSDGFTLETPDATIVDLGTEYAVLLDDESTEIHVFEGSVIWEPGGNAKATFAEQIEAGEARRYVRSRPTQGARIPLGMRQFVRSLEAAERDAAGSNLLAYDGFENLAGHIRRGRSGFGWSGGWESGQRGRRKIATVVDAPADAVFGMVRSGRRLLQLTEGDAIRRQLERPLTLESDNGYFVSFLLQRDCEARDSGRYFQASLSGDGGPKGRRVRREIAFGVSSDGLPFIKIGGSIKQAAPPIENSVTYFCVMKILASAEGSVQASYRVFRPGESIHHHEPSVWTCSDSTSLVDSSLSHVRLSVAAEGTYRIDELKIGTTWQSVTATTGDL
jgi:hypothetical protein